MNLAQLIRAALTNPTMRMALEAGTVPAGTYGLSAQEIASAAEALRVGSRTHGKGFTQVFTLPGWRPWAPERG